MTANQPENAGREVAGYRRMLERAASTLKEAVKHPLPSLRHLIDTAKHTAVELKELSHDEAERIGYYLRRDVEDAAQHAREGRRELRDWLRFDIALLEDRLLEFLEPLVDHTRLELDRLAMEADAQGWHTGEVIGPGTLYCEACGQALHLHRVSHIPPCPRCRATAFHRRHG
ncbi:MAG: zinc ribbon-containing protein [Chromatiales bacterium]